MLNELTIIYRGSLKSCNYRCSYCPLRLSHTNDTALAHDKLELEEFVHWVASLTNIKVNVLFTPYGEALIHQPYQKAIARLSKVNNLVKVAIQTNLSATLDWTDQCQTDKLGLWCSYHPSQVFRSQFLSKCSFLKQRNISFSVGIVGTKDNINEIEVMRRVLPKDIYLWVNAYKQTHGNYTESELRRLEAVDYIFSLNNRIYKTKGKACHCGESVISVAGNGEFKRCHFSNEILGNIYNSNFEQMLGHGTCPETNCRCHIGYVHLKELNMKKIYGSKLLERIPKSFQRGQALYE